MQCPGCTKAELSKDGSCRLCAGIWLDIDHVDRIASDLDFTGGRYSERHCPLCDEKMDEPLVFGVPVDQCTAHGMWFDKAELDEVMKRSRGAGWQAEDARADMSPADSLTNLVVAARAWRRDQLD